jgi:NAD(P)-dependent dehydrogenase (short-subunit alcohol dehydrogenase family)
MKDLTGKVAAVTGAASGIGRALATNLAAKGCHLAISDVNEQGLQETAELAAEHDVDVTTHIVDVADREQVYQYAEDVVKQHGKVNIIINNAGVAVGDTIEDVSYEDFEWIVGINFWGVVYGTKAFLPYLKKEPEGHIVNISSINGIVPNPLNGPYCSTKFAVKGFTETLRQELEGTSVGVTVIHPGGIGTEIVRNARIRRHINPDKTAVELASDFDEHVVRNTADFAAQTIITGIEKNKQRVLVGGDAKFMDWMTRLFPVTATKFVHRLTHKWSE